MSLAEAVFRQHIVLEQRIDDSVRLTGANASHVDALASGAEPQYRVIRNAPIDVGRDELRALFLAALSYW